MAITLNSKVYNAVGWNQNGQFVWNETSAGVPSGFSYLTTKVANGTGKQATAVKWNLSMPVVATDDSDCVCTGEVLRSYFSKIEITLPASSTAAERADILARIQALVLTSQFANSITGPTQASA